MTALTSPLIWYTTRASGIVSLLLLSLVMALGIMTATRVGGRQLPRFAVAEIHRRISLLTMIFLVLHIATTVIDTYVNVGLFAALVPFTSTYKTLWVACGSVAFDLLIAVTLTSLLRQRISHNFWRTIHWLSYLAWPIALVHTIFIGTDLRFGWMDLFVAGCIGIVMLGAAWRFWAHPRPGGALTAVPSRTAPRDASLLKRPSTTSPKSAPPAVQGRPVASSTPKRPR